MARVIQVHLSILRLQQARLKDLRLITRLSMMHFIRRQVRWQLHTAARIIRHSPTRLQGSRMTSRR